MNIEATIIVMVYKNLNQVIQTLDSIKKQTYSNYEVIVSDDGSPNYTQEDFDKITEQYKNEFTYFKLINNGINRGTVKHFNSLISQAKGTIICPLSSGDQFYNENSLQEIMNAFDQEDKLIYTSKRMIKKENSIEYYPSLYQVSLLDQSNHFFEYIMKYGNFVSGASTYYKKEIFDKYGLFDEKYKLLEDYPFYVNLAFNNEKIGYIDYPTIQYELGGISTASNRNPLLDQDYVTLFKDVLSQKDIHLSHMTKRALNYRIDKITKKYNFVPDAEANLKVIRIKEIPKRYVVFYGRIGEEKGIRVLMKIWNELSEIPLVVMGGGPLEAEFKVWAEKQPNVYFLGYTQHDKCLSIVKGGEFVIFPSIWYEGCSMVEIETESLGKGLVVTDLGFSAEAIDNGKNGYKVKLGDVKEFVNQIRALWNDPDKCIEIGENARKDYEEKYLPEDNYQQLIKIYKTV